MHFRNEKLPFIDMLHILCMYDTPTECNVNNNNENYNIYVLKKLFMFTCSFYFPFLKSHIQIIKVQKKIISFSDNQEVCARVKIFSGGNKINLRNILEIIQIKCLWVSVV